MTSTPSLLDVDAFEVPSFLAERISRIHDVPRDFADGLIIEAKRMLYLCSISKQAVAPSDRVDWAWHEMIMFTKFYKSFSECIGDFIHHVPNPPPELDEKEETWEHMQETLGKHRRGSDTYIQTKENYEKFFHTKPNPLYWP